MANNESESCEEVVCEFFGIKITTKNPNIARVLTTDLGNLMAMDVMAVKDILTEDRLDKSERITAADEPLREPQDESVAPDNDGDATSTQVPLRLRPKPDHD